MFPCTVHDFLMMSTNDALLWRFVFVYLELSLYLCFLVINIHVTPISFVMYFTNYFIRQRSLYLHIHILLLKMSIEFRLCCESGCYIYGCSTQICWYCRISVFYVHLKFIRLVSFRMVLYIYY